MVCSKVRKDDTEILYKKVKASYQTVVQAGVLNGLAITTLTDAVVVESF